MKKDRLIEEFEFITSKSSGKGGQHVNTTETKVTVVWNVFKSSALHNGEKGNILIKLRNKISAEGNLLVSSQKGRSQQANKEDAITKMIAMISKALIKPKERIATKASKSSKEKKKTEKINRAKIKEGRRKVQDLE